MRQKSASGEDPMKDNVLDSKSPFFLRDYHRKYHPVIHGDIKMGFCFGKDETPLTTLQPLQMSKLTEKTPRIFVSTRNSALIPTPVTRYVTPHEHTQRTRTRPARPRCLSLRLHRAGVLLLRHIRRANG